MNQIDHTSIVFLYSDTTDDALIYNTANTTQCKPK